MIDPNEGFAFHLQAQPVVGSADMRFTPVDTTNSEIKTATTMHGKTMIWKSVLALSKSTMVDRTQEQYETLKRAIEAP